MDNIIDQSMANMKNIDIKFEEDDPIRRIQDQVVDLYDPDCILQTTIERKHNIIIQDAQQIIIESINQKSQKVNTKKFDTLLLEDVENQDIDDVQDSKSKTTSDEDYQNSLEKGMLIEEYDDDDAFIGFGRESNSKRQNKGRNTRKYNTRGAKKNKNDESEDYSPNSSSDIYDKRGIGKKREGMRTRRNALKSGYEGRNEQSSFIEYDPCQKNRQRKNAQNFLDNIEDEFSKKQDNSVLLDVDSLIAAQKIKSRVSDDQNTQKEIVSEKKNQNLIEGQTITPIDQNKQNTLNEQKESKNKISEKIIENQNKQTGNNEKLIEKNEKPANDIQFPQINPVLQLQLQKLAQQLQQQQQFPYLLQQGQQQNNILNGIPNMNNPLLLQGMNQILLQASMNEIFKNMKKEENPQQQLPQLIPNLIQPGTTQSVTSKESNEVSTQNQKKGGRRGYDQRQYKNPKEDESFHLNSPSRKRKYNTRRIIKNYAESPINDDKYEKESKKDKKQSQQPIIQKDIQDIHQDNQKQNNNNQLQDCIKKYDAELPQNLNILISKYHMDDPQTYVNQKQIQQKDQRQKNNRQQRKKPNEYLNQNQFNDETQNVLKDQNGYYSQNEQKFNQPHPFSLQVDKGIRYKNEDLQKSMYQKNINEYNQIINFDENEDQQRLISQLPKEGHFMFEDKPKCTGSTRYINNEIFIEVIWEQRKNGDIPTPTIFSSEVIKQYDKDFLIEFYETRVRKTNERISINQQQQHYPQQQQTAVVQKPINQLVNNSKNSYIDSLRKDIYKTRYGITEQTDTPTKDKNNNASQQVSQRTPEKHQFIYDKYANQKQENKKQGENNKQYIDLEQYSSDEDISINKKKSQKIKEKKQNKEIYLIESSTFNSLDNDSFCIEDPYRKFIQDEGLVATSVKEIQNKIQF